MKKQLFGFCISALLFTAQVFAAENPLLDETALSARLAKQPEYQLLDARSTEAQRSAPLAFSTRYQKSVVLKKGMVLIVADDDAGALAIVQAIPADAARSVYAVKGGAAAWKRVVAKAPPPSTMSDSFVIPMNTCEQGKPLQKLKRNKAATQSPTPK